MFIPTTKKEIEQLGWDALDIILVTGDAYIDSPFIGVAVIGKVLINAGYRVGIIAQPDTDSDADICRLGEPQLFWGVTGGCIDSMVANRTASGKKRKTDDYTPGGENIKRPDRAVLVYTNLIKKYFKTTCPIVLGGIEASLRRTAHYDFWSNQVRKSILFDAKADYLLYGMADKTVVELADALRSGKDVRSLRGLCYIANEIPPDALELPPFEQVRKDKELFGQMFHTFYRNNDPLTARILVQQQDNRYLVQNPPPLCLTTEELDRIHDLEYERELHPYYRQEGEVRALETIRFSIATHRGCYGECNFCAIAVHQGRTVMGRSRESILREAHEITGHRMFKGTIHDVGGPTANMYGIECEKKLKEGSCRKKRCLYPEICKSMKVDHREQIALLQELRQVKGIRKVVVASGIRYDMILADKKHGLKYLRELVRHHISGQMKIAPEHTEQNVLSLMGKPSSDTLLQFRKLFVEMTKKERMNQFLTYYLIAAHPGCTIQDMNKLKNFCREHLKVLPRQIQIFTPTPSTYSSAMYWTEFDIINRIPCFVEKTDAGRDKQKNILAPQNTPRKFRKK